MNLEAIRPFYRDTNTFRKMNFRTKNEHMFKFHRTKYFFEFLNSFDDNISDGDRIAIKL